VFLFWNVIRVDSIHAQKKFVRPHNRSRVKTSLDSQDCNGVFRRQLDFGASSAKIDRLADAILHSAVYYKTPAILKHLCRQINPWTQKKIKFFLQAAGIRRRYLES